MRQLDLQLDLFFRIKTESDRLAKEANQQLEYLFKECGPVIKEITELLMDDTPPKDYPSGYNYYFASSLVNHISMVWGGFDNQSLISKINMINSFLINCLLDDSQVYINELYDEQYKKYVENLISTGYSENYPCIFSVKGRDDIKRLTPKQFLDFCKLQIKKEKTKYEEDKLLFDEDL